MQSRGLTPEAIAAAADRLIARGEKPSLRAVRAELGGGSLGTIQPALAAWRARRPQIDAAGLGVSAEVQRAIVGDIERAAAAARAELATDLAETREARDALAEELRQQLTVAADAEQRAAEAIAEAERHAGTIATLERALSEAREQIAREHEAAERARREAAEAAVRLELLLGCRPSSRRCANASKTSARRAYARRSPPPSCAAGTRAANLLGGRLLTGA